MMVTTWFDGVSLPLLFISTVAFALLAIFIGIRLSALGGSSVSGESIGPAAGATLGLLAFMLAFTFNMTASRFDGRKQLLIAETNAITATYLRSGLLPAPYASKLSALVMEYADLRAKLALGEISINETISRSEKIQNEMWQQAELIAQELPPSVYQSLFVQSLNTMIDLQGSRIILALQFRIPTMIWSGLYSIAGLAMMLVGYQLGASGRRRILVSFTLATAFSAVIFMIADLDRVGQGFTTVNQQPFIELPDKLRRLD